jgi:hypothetical protein
MKRLMWLVAVALLAAACTDDSATVTTSAPATTSTTVAVETTTTTMAPPPGIDALPESQQPVLEELIAVTEEVRGLRFIDPPIIQVVTPDELERLVREDIEENIEDVDVDQALYQLLGLIDADVELLDLYTNVLGEQVAGFYDPDTRELVVPLRSEEFGALERSTIVHELTHALTDQHFDFGTTYNALIDEERFDEAAAYQSVIEGDAVLAELRYLRGLTADEQREVIEESLGIDRSALDSAPRFFQESLIFPYVQGQIFMDRLFQLEGQEGIDRAYAEPPVSTEQIISPEDYGRDMPVAVELPTVDLEGYEVEDEGVWGELSFELMFNQVLGGRPEAADGWGGDSYRTYFDGTEVAMVLSYVGDSAEDAAEMETALLEYVAATLEAEPGEDRTFIGEDFGFVERDGSEVLFVVASDPEAGAALVAGLVEALSAA